MREQDEQQHEPIDALEELQELDESYDFEEQLTEPRDESRSPLVIGGAVVGVLVGLFLWGSVAFSALAAFTGLFDDDTGPSVSDSLEIEDETPLAEETPFVIDCAAGTTGLSPEQFAAFQAQCATPTPEAGDATAPADSGENRAECDAIRGTEYRSQAERQWFLDNCL